MDATPLEDRREAHFSELAARLFREVPQEFFQRIGKPERAALS